MMNLRAQPSDIEKYSFIEDIHDYNETVSSSFPCPESPLIVEGAALNGFEPTSGWLFLGRFGCNKHMHSRPQDLTVGSSRIGPGLPRSVVRSHGGARPYRLHAHCGPGVQRIWLQVQQVLTATFSSLGPVDEVYI